MQIYLDNAATTKTDEKVLKAMKPYFDKDYGNASSLHSMGQKARTAIEKARAIIAKSINASSDEIIFTSGGTESNNLALKGIAFANKDRGNHIITTKIEHECVVQSCKWLEKQGFKITYLNVDNEGFVDLKQLEDAMTSETILVSIIHGNNEIGTIQDMEEIGRICKKRNVPLHTDACQSYTKTLIDVKKQNLALVTLNAHKIHGPKGTGALYVKKGTKITPLQHGGGHEFNLRSGTENVPGIVGFAEASRLLKKSDIIKMEKLRDYAINEILKIKNTVVNGPLRKNRLCNNANFCFKFVEGESIVAYLSDAGIMASTGSACSSHSLEQSHVLLAIGRSAEIANGSLRLSISKHTTKKEIAYSVSKLKIIIERLRKMSPLTE